MVNFSSKTFFLLTLLLVIFTVLLATLPSESTIANPGHSEKPPKHVGEKNEENPSSVKSRHSRMTNNGKGKHRGEYNSVYMNEKRKPKSRDGLRYGNYKHSRYFSISDIF